MTTTPAATAGRSPAATPFPDVLAGVRKGLDRELEAWLRERRAALARSSPEGAELVDEVERLVAGGGKRLRPALLLLAHDACGGGGEATALRLAMAVELLHTYLLIHDDVMDQAPTRRAHATTHVAFADHHRLLGRHGDPEHFGRSVAILAGDLAHTWAVELSRPAPESATRVFDAMCEEVIGGQYLEMLLPYRREPEEAELLRALRLKSGRYSVERPVEMGALLASAEPGVLEGLREWGEAAGEAFQLQDDVLGTFGDADAVGKPVASDLAEGKFTFLVYHALAGAAPEDRKWLRGALGREDLSEGDLERARSIVRASGGLAAVEDMIDERLERARRALEAVPLPAAAREPFFGFLDYLRERDR